MTYDPTKHINRENLAALIGVKTGAIATELANYPHGAPTRLGSVRNGRSKIVVYDKQEAIAWAKSRGKASSTRVPPRQPAPFRPLQLSPGLRQNLARASEVYPHSIRSAGSAVGNELAYSPEFGRLR